MKYLHTLLIIYGLTSCRSSKEINLSDNISVNITQQFKLFPKTKLHDIDFKTRYNYINFEIINNNDVGIYMPNIQDYYRAIDEKKINILERIWEYEENNDDYNYISFSNGENIKYFHDSFFTDLYIKQRNLLIENEFNKYNENALANNINYSKNEVDIIKEDLFGSKYGMMILLSPHDSINIVVGVNYLFRNKILNDKIKTVGFSFDYKAVPTTDSDSIKIPLDYIHSDFIKNIKFNKEYPKKILGKYHLITSLKSKDTLTIKIR